MLNPEVKLPIAVDIITIRERTGPSLSRINSDSSGSGLLQLRQHDTIEASN